MRALNFKSLLCNNTETLQLFCTCHIIVVIHYQHPRVFLEGFCSYISMTTLIRVYEIINSCSNMYLLTEWEGRTGKYLARSRGHDVRTERSEVRAS